MAIKAIRDGTELTPELMKFYLAAGRIRAREADDDVVRAAILNAKVPSSAFGDPFEKAVTDRFRALIDISSGDANIEDL